MLVVESSCPQSSHIVPHMGQPEADNSGFHKNTAAAPGLFGRQAMP